MSKSGTGSGGDAGTAKPTIRAQSEVVGIILLVGVVVVLMMVIGAFVLGQGASKAEDQPNVDIESDLNETELTITHLGGDQLDSSNVVVILEGAATQRVALSDFDETPGNRFEPGTVWRLHDSLADTPINGIVDIIIVHDPSDTIVHDDTHEVG